MSQWLKCQCKYCGISWIESYTSYSIYSSPGCKHCGDSNIVRKAIQYEKIDYYAQDPKQKSKTKEKDKEPDWMD